jgi:hypothetical protein
MFSPIHKFDNLSDYLPILNGSIAADLIVIFILYYTPYFNSKFLKQWYENYRLSAVLADVLILVIGMIITRYIFKKLNWSWNLTKFLITILVVQVIHDYLFYLFFKSVPVGKNKMLDVFKKYAQEVGYKAILGDSFMIIISVLLSSYYAGLSVNTNIILLISLTYLVPYFIFSQ